MSELVAVGTHDVDEARVAVSRTFYATRIRLLDDTAPFSIRFHGLRLGAVTIAAGQCGASIAMSFGELGAYHIHLPRTGQLAWRQGRGDPALATAARAGILQPVGDTRIDRLSAGAQLIAVKIDRTVLEHHLNTQLAQPSRFPIAFAPYLDVSPGPGRSWASLLDLVAGELQTADSLLYHPIIADRLEEAIIFGLLHSAEHPYRDALERPSRPYTPRPVKRAMDAIHAQPEQPFTTARLAELAGVSIRTLQDGFHRHLGTTPMTYLRHVRLDHAHRDLRQADPARTTVADIAHRWGFLHLGRFAATYQATYGQTPSRTLRR